MVIGLDVLFCILARAKYALESGLSVLYVVAIPNFFRFGFGTHINLAPSIVNSRSRKNGDENHIQLDEMN